MELIKACIEKSAAELNTAYPLAFVQRPEYIELLCKTYGHHAYFAKQFTNNRLSHVLPFTVVSVPLLGRKIISMPFDGSYGDHIALQNEAASAKLYEEIINFAELNRINYIEIRSRSPNNKILDLLGFKKYNSLVISELPLQNLYENRKKLSKGHKSAIVFSKKNGLEISTDSNYHDLRTFYNIMSSNMRDYGTPMYPFSYFSNLWESYHKTGNVKLIKGVYNGRMICGLFMLIDPPIAIYKYGAAMTRYIPLRPYQAMVWAAMEEAINNGCVVLNMGTSFKEDAGLIHFKKGFGALSFPLYTYSYSFGSNAYNIDEYQARFWIIKRLWKYIPISVTQILGKLFWMWFC